MILGKCAGQLLAHTPCQMLYYKECIDLLLAAFGLLFPIFNCKLPEFPFLYDANARPAKPLKIAGVYPKMHHNTGKIT